MKFIIALSALISLTFACTKKQSEDKPSPTNAAAADEKKAPTGESPAAPKPIEGAAEQPATAEPAKQDVSVSEDADAVTLCGFLGQCQTDDWCQQDMAWAKKTLEGLEMKTEWGQSVRQSMLDDLKAIADIEPAVGSDRLLERVEQRKIEGPQFECKNVADWPRGS